MSTDGKFDEEIIKPLLTSTKTETLEIIFERRKPSSE